MQGFGAAQGIRRRREREAVNAKIEKLLEAAFSVLQHDSMIGKDGEDDPNTDPEYAWSRKILREKFRQILGCSND